MTKLTYHEGKVLALVMKWQPVTAYFLRKALLQQLASDLTDSPGSIYPAIRRLKALGMVEASATDDRRGKEHLCCTQAGEQAVREWLLTLDPAEVLPDEAWRNRILFVEALSPQEAIGWLFSARRALEATLGDLDEQADLSVGVGRALALSHARLVTQARLAWANDAIAIVSEAAMPAEADPQPSPARPGAGAAPANRRRG